MLNSENIFIDVPDEVVAKKINIQNKDEAQIFIDTYLRQQKIERKAKKMRSRYGTN
jgi:hypothetical protein